MASNKETESRISCEWETNEQGKKAIGTVLVFRNNEKEPFLHIYGDFFNCATYGTEVVGVLDSESADLGEIAWQLYENPRVSREKYTPSFLYAFSDIAEEEIPAYKKLTTEELSEITHAVIAMIQDLLKPGFKSREILFAYLGNESVVPVDQVLHDTFQNAKYAVFRCVAGLTCSKDAFIAVYSSYAVNDEAYRKRQSNTEYCPKEIIQMDDEDEYDIEAIEMDIDEIPLYERTTNALMRAGINTVMDLIEHTEEDLRALKGIGPVCMNDIKQTLSQYGLGLAKWIY